MSSLKRILSLAKRTGGPLVIFDAETGTEFVLHTGSVDDLQHESENDLRIESLTTSKEMFLDDATDISIDTVEIANTSNEPYFEFERRTFIEEMNSMELLEQINRDIASWKSYQDIESEVERAFALEEELIVEDEEDVQTDWHTPASVFEHYSSAIKELNESIAQVEALTPYNTEEEVVAAFEETSIPTSENTPVSSTSISWEEEESTWSELEPIQEVAPSVSVPESITMEEVPFDAPMVEATGESEPLTDNDAPVFYTEPVL